MAKGSGEGVLKECKVIGYIRMPTRDQLFISSQDARLESFSSREGLDVVQFEHEANNGNLITRIGLWKALRLMTCHDCEPRTMPMTDDYSYWIREALKPCACGHARPCHGLIVDDISIVCTNPSAGTRFILDLCVAKKHLYVVREKRCMSCCNPATVEFVRKQLMKDDPK
jgi:hypothetical protein